MAMHLSQDEPQFKPMLVHLAIECVTARHLSQLVCRAAVQPAGFVDAVPAAGVAEGVAAGADVELRWSGQHIKLRQHGNIHATSSGTKQHVDFLSCMQLYVHTFMSVQRPA